MWLGTCIFLIIIHAQEYISWCTRVVKGVGLKIQCVSFVGSNPTASSVSINWLHTKLFVLPAWIADRQKSESISCYLLNEETHICNEKQILFSENISERHIHSSVASLPPSPTPPTHCCSHCTPNHSHPSTLLSVHPEHLSVHPSFPSPHHSTFPIQNGQVWTRDVGIRVWGSCRWAIRIHLLWMMNGSTHFWVFWNCIHSS